MIHAPFRFEPTKRSPMRAVLVALFLFVSSSRGRPGSGAGCRQSGDAGQTTAPPTAAGPATSPTRSQLVAQYPQGIADRPRGRRGGPLRSRAGTGAGSSTLREGFGEVPNVRYGIPRFPRGRPLLGSALHRGRGFAGTSPDQPFGRSSTISRFRNQPTTNYYPILRPGGFVEFPRSPSFPSRAQRSRGLRVRGANRARHERQRASRRPAHLQLVRAVGARAAVEPAVDFSRSTSWVATSTTPAAHRLRA